MDWRRVQILVAISFAFAVIGVVPALAQLTSSSIVGTVRDETGGVIPGVTVEVSSPALIEGTRTAITDQSGEYRVNDLRPGNYSITLSLEGFQTIRLRDVNIRAAFTATINEVMKPKAVEESVTVTGQSPLVDLRSAGTEKAMNNELIEGVPTARGIFALAEMMPAMAVNKPDVGGSQTHQLQSISVHGSSTQDVTWNVDGLNITASNSSGGLTATYFNQGLQEDVSIQTKAFPAEIGAGGVSINMITKSGSNKFRGIGFFSGTSHSLQSNNVSSDQTALGLTAPGGVDKLIDFNPEFGGPLLKDRLWFYSSYRYWLNNRLVASTFNPDGTQALDPQNFQFFSGTITGRLGSKNRVSGYLDWNKKQRDMRRDLSSTFNFISPEATEYQRQGGPTGNLKWTSTPSNTVMFEAGLSFDRILWHLFDQPNISPTALSVNDIVLSTLKGAFTDELAYDYPARRQMTAILSWFPKLAGTHNIRTGVQIAELPYSTGYTDDQHGDIVARYSNSVPTSVVVYNTPTNSSYVMWDYAGFAQDSWSLKRLTINAGLRYERWSGYIPPQSAPAGTYVPARSFPQIQGPVWNSVVPRLAAVYDVFGNGKTAVKVSASKYMQQEAAGLLTNVNPMRLLTEVRTWTGQLDSNGLPVGVGPSLGGLNAGASASFAPNLSWPYQWEYTASVEHQLLPNTGITINYYHRRYNSLITTVNQALTASAYTPFNVTNPYTGAPLTIYNQIASSVGQFNNVVVNQSGLYTAYNAFELTFDRRFSNNLTLFGGLTLGHNKGCYTDTNNPNDNINACGYDPYDSTTMGQVSAMYTLPGRVTLSTHFQHETGQPLQLTYTFTKTQDPGLTQVNQAVRLTASGDTRKPNVNLLDFRVSKAFQLHGSLKVDAILDLYNITNNNAAVTQVQIVGPALGHISEAVDGRLLRLGARLSF